jgi:hypothetical protein
MVQVGCTINYGRSACGKKWRISNVAVLEVIMWRQPPLRQAQGRLSLSVERSSTLFAVGGNRLAPSHVR